MHALVYTIDMQSETLVKTGAVLRTIGIIVLCVMAVYCLVSIPFGLILLLANLPLTLLLLSPLLIGQVMLFIGRRHTYVAGSYRKTSIWAIVGVIAVAILISVTIQLLTAFR